MTYGLAPDSPRKASAVTFGRELTKAIGVRGIPRNELWRASGIGRTALDNYRTGYSLPRSETAATLAALLDWPRLREIVAAARSRACRRCGRAFTIETGAAARRYCSLACREIAERVRAAGRRVRQAGQTGDNRRRYQAVATLRSGIRIAEEAAAELRAAVDAMCRDCEPGGVCRTADCPLRAFSPLPFRVHGTREARTGAEVRADTVAKRWTPAARAAHGELTAALHREGRIPYGRNHPAHDPERREAWLAAQRAGKARQHAGTLV